MPPRREPPRTEHCWPVAHSLDDLLDVIPDPATYNPEEGVLIKRFMLEPVRNQFIRAIADRFEAAGWGMIYLVNNNWRGDEILDVIPTAQTICVRPGWQKRVEIAKERNQEMGLKSLVASEIPEVIEVLYLPFSVKQLNPRSCKICGRDVFLQWNNASKVARWTCKVGHSSVQWAERASTKCAGSGKGLHADAGRVPDSTRRPWSHEEEQLARQLRDQGLTWREVGERLGRSRSAISHFLRKGGMAGTAARQKTRALLAARNRR